MPAVRTLADSGFFIGLFDGRDRHHRRCVDFLRDYRGQILTTWQVITESLAMLDERGQESLLIWIMRGVDSGMFLIDCTKPDDLELLLSITRKYRDQPMDFADASLYVLAVRSGVTRILSVDRRDFQVFRLPGRRRFENVLYPA